MSYIPVENKTEILDGQLQSMYTLPNDLVLVIDTAYSGPTDQVYVAQDLPQARRLFGERSPIINLLNRAVNSGYSNIALYRLGGVAHEYVNIFGPGTSLRLTDASVTAADNLKVYIGPEPRNSTRHCVIVYEGSRVIFSNVLGAEVYSSRVAIDGFNKRNNTALVGRTDAPVAFTSILDNIGVEGSSSVVSTDTTTTHANQSSPTRFIGVSLSDISGFDKSTSDISSIRLHKESGEELKYILNTDETFLIVNEYVDGSSEKLPSSTNVVVSFIVKDTKEKLKQKEIEYTPAKDSVNATWKELYEELDKALEKLEFVNTKVILVGDWASAPNVAHGSRAADKLEYLNVTENEYGVRQYEWSPYKYLYEKQGAPGQTTHDVSEADIDLNGLPLIVKEYNEVDMVHRIATTIHNRLAEGQFLHLVTGVKGPTAYNNKAISDWVGVPPKRDLSGRIVENGTGLLGHRLMVGDVTYSGGYFATTNGYVDGDIITDRVGAPIDLGKYISVVASQVTSQALTSKVSSGAAVYAGLVGTLKAGQSTTNKLVPGHALMSQIPEAKRKMLAEAGYVVFVERTRGLTVYSGDVATRDESDFDYISSAITISEVVKLIASVCDPYLGQGKDLILLTAMKAQLETALAEAQAQGWFRSYRFDIRSDGPNSIFIPYEIEVKDELRRISNSIRLSNNNFNVSL